MPGRKGLIGPPGLDGFPGEIGNRGRDGMQNLVY